VFFFWSSLLRSGTCTPGFLQKICLYSIVSCARQGSRQIFLSRVSVSF
jgi:hypothetical protein